MIAPHATATMRIEDCAQLPDVLAELGCPLPDPAAVASVRTDINSRGPTGSDPIPDHLAVKEAMALADAWGYR